MRPAVVDARKLEGGPVGPSIVVRLLASQNLLLGELRRGLGPDLSLARFDLLAQLSRESGQTLASLSRKMLVTAGNLTGLVDRAERDGIVERRPDPTDRRLTRVFLTTRGEKLAQRAIARHAELAERLVAALDRSERDDLRRLLGRLRDVLEGARTPTKGSTSTSERSSRSSVKSTPLKGTAGKETRR